MAPIKVSVEKYDNPNEELSIPDWVNPEYFQKILEKDYPGFKSILNFTPVAATSPGENYISILLRAHFVLLLKDDTTTRVSYIVKTSLLDPKISNVINSMNPFAKEREVYESLVLKFEKIYADAGKAVQFAPKCKHYEKCDERETIVLEDLKQRNFENVGRFEGFDLVHMEVVLKKLAEFHAASAVHYEQCGPYSKVFNHSFHDPKNREYLETSSEMKRQLYVSVMEDWGDCEKYIKIWPQAKDTIDWFEKYGAPDPDEINVLNHGDCWSNNIMFRYDEDGVIRETLLIDFQMCKWGSPAQDLYYVIVTSAQYDIRLKEFDRFLRIYQEHLAENLKLLKYSKPIPSLKDLHILMIKYSMWGVFTATNILPLSSVDPEEKADLNNAINNVEFRRKCLMTPRYVRIIKQLLPWWENRGALQISS